MNKEKLNKIRLLKICEMLQSETSKDHPMGKRKSQLVGSQKGLSLKRNIVQFNTSKSSNESIYYSVNEIVTDKMKKNRKQKDSVIDFSQQYSKKKPRPHTKAEENDIVIGKVIFWGFIILLPLLAFVFYLASRGEGSEANIIGWIGWIIIFSLVILFGSYLILGVIFKWNHARACARSFIYNARKIDLRGPWTAEEKRESLMMGIFLTVSAIALIVLSLI